MALGLPTIFTETAPPGSWPSVYWQGGTRLSAFNTYCKQPLPGAKPGEPEIVLASPEGEEGK